MLKTTVTSRTGNLVNLISALILAQFITSCQPARLSDDEVVNQYGPEVINYFYETAFHVDRGVGVMDEASRWKEDIRVSLHGDMLENDSAFVKEALLEINSLDIPISMSLVADSVESNLLVFFGDAKTIADGLMLDTVVTVGIAKADANSGIIERARVGILNEAKLYSQMTDASATFLRKGTILEEMTQALGIIGDSFTHYSSTFFEGANERRSNSDGLSELDRKVVELLYDNSVFRGRIMRKGFEKRFSDVLYNRITPEKLRHLANEYGLERHDLDSLREILFRPETGERFVKFPRTAFLKLAGDYTERDFEFCNALIARLNAITPWFQLKGEKEHTIWNKHPSLTIRYEEGEEYLGVTNTQVGLDTSKTMFPYHILGVIWMRFHDAKNETIPHQNAVFFHQLTLTRALFKALGLSARDNILVNDTSDSIQIDKKYEDYFRFLYDPRFPSGITKAEFEKLLENMNSAPAQITSAGSSTFNHRRFVEQISHAFRVQ